MQFYELNSYMYTGLSKQKVQENNISVQMGPLAQRMFQEHNISVHLGPLALCAART